MVQTLRLDKRAAAATNLRAQRKHLKTTSGGRWASLPMTFGLIGRCRPTLPSSVVRDDVEDVGDRALRGCACEVAVSAAVALSFVDS